MNRDPSWKVSLCWEAIENLAGNGETLVKEDFLEEVGQNTEGKEGRDRVKEKDKEWKSSVGEHPV